MLRWLYLSFVIIACALVSGARAESTRFFCSTEEAAELVAERIVINQESADEVAVPMIKSGTCFYIPAEIEILVIRKGKVFKDGHEGVVVVAFDVNEENGLRTELYALLHYDDD